MYFEYYLAQKNLLTIVMIISVIGETGHFRSNYITNVVFSSRNFDSETRDLIFFENFQDFESRSESRLDSCK